MNLIEWNDEFSVGDASIDYEHKELIALINQLYILFHDKPEKRDVMDMAGEIYAKISAHFALEEKVMRDRKYQGYTEHKTDHERLLDELLNMMDDCEGKGQIDYDAMSVFMKDWFSQHFKTMDAKLHRLLG